MVESDISEDFPFESKYLEIDNVKIHYIDEGEGDPMLFLHGVPTSNYVWRNIIPTLSKSARCIAPDLVGMGKSDKPKIDYTVFDHIKFIEAFIEKLGLKKITLVLHGWGSVIGFHYAMRNEKNVKAIAFYESHVRATAQWDMLSLPVQQFAMLFDDRNRSYHEVVEKNFFIDTVLPTGVIRDLSDTELSHYRKPFESPEDRLPLWQYIQELPVGKDRTDVVNLIDDYSKKLRTSKLPKLMFFAVPGFVTTIDTVNWCRENLQNLEIIDLGEALHFVQESNPTAFAENLQQWYQEL